MSKTGKVPASLGAEKSVSKQVFLRCIPCSHDDRQCDACCFCVQCVEHLCSDCSKDHRKIKLTRNHVLLEGKKMPTDATAFEEMAKLTSCKVHQDRDVEFLCITDNEIICALCLRDGHRLCTDVESIRRYFKGKKQACKEYLDRCISLKHRAEEIHSRAFWRVHHMDRSLKIEKEISEFVTELESMAHLFKTDYKRKMQKSNEVTSGISKKVSELEVCLSRLNTNIAVCEFTLKFGTDAQLTVLSKNLSECLIDIEKDVANQSSDLGDASLDLKYVALMMNRVRLPMASLKSMCTIVFGPSKTMEPLLKINTTPISEKGDSEVSKKVDTKDVGTQVDNDIGKPEPNLLHAASAGKETGTCKYSGQSEAEISSESASPSLFESRVKNIAKHDISVYTQYESCKHTSSFLLKDGNMIFLDKENNILKHVSDTFEVINWYTFPPGTEVNDTVYLSGRLIGIAHEDVIETFCVCSSCQEFHEVDELSMDSSVCSIMPLYDDDTYVDDDDSDDDRNGASAGGNVDAGNDDNDGYGYDDTSDDNNSNENEYDDNDDNNFDDGEDEDDVSRRLAILYADKHVKFRNKNVRLVRTFQKYRHEKTVPTHLRSPFMIRAPNKDEFIIAEENRVTVFERSGKMKWYLKMVDTERVNFITYDTEGNIYICDTDSNKILQVSSASNKSRRICRVIISDLEKPSTILFNPVNRTLVVGCTDDNFVYTYQFI